MWWERSKAGGGEGPAGTSLLCGKLSALPSAWAPAVFCLPRAFHSFYVIFSQLCGISHSRMGASSLGWPVSECHCHKSPLTQWLKAPQIHCLQLWRPDV